MCLLVGWPVLGTLKTAPFSCRRVATRREITARILSVSADFHARVNTKTLNGDQSSKIEGRPPRTDCGLRSRRRLVPRCP